MNTSTFTRFTNGIRHSMLALAILGAGASHSMAQDDHAHMDAIKRDQSSNASAFLKIVRDSTERFKDVSAAMAEGYILQFGCVSGSDSGAMGLHYVNANLVSLGILDPTRPQIVIYEPMPDGKMALVAVEYITFKGPASLEGQLFNFNGAPNRYGLDPFYELHVWAWKANPRGAYADMNPDVSCAHAH